MTAEERSYRPKRAIGSRDAARSHELTRLNTHISKLGLSTMWLLEPLGDPWVTIAHHLRNRGAIQQLAP